MFDWILNVLLFIQEWTKKMSKQTILLRIFSSLLSSKFAWSILYTLSHYPASIYLLKVDNRSTRTKVWNMFKVNNKDSKMMPLTSIWCLYRWLWTYLPLCSSISIVNFEQVNAGWDKAFNEFMKSFITGAEIIQLDSYI